MLRVIGLVIYVVWKDCIQPMYDVCIYYRESGAASRCCYSKNGNLMYAGDSVSGSFSAKVHPDGIYPYGVAGRIPAMSHWIFDKLPYLWCCKWADDKSECIDHFMAKRPTPDCKKHQQTGHGKYLYLMLIYCILCFR